MFSSNYTNRLFGRTRGRSKKKNYLKNYYETVDKFKFQNFNEETEYILDVGTGYGETSIFLANKFSDKVVISCEKYVDGNIVLLYTYETDLGDGWENQEVHNNSESTRLKALKMGSNIIEYVFNRKY